MSKEIFCELLPPGINNVHAFKKPQIGLEMIKELFHEQKNLRSETIPILITAQYWEENGDYENAIYCYKKGGILLPTTKLDQLERGLIESNNLSNNQFAIFQLYKTCGRSQLAEFGDRCVGRNSFNLAFECYREALTDEYIKSRNQSRKTQDIEQKIFTTIEKMIDSSTLKKEDIAYISETFITLNNIYRSYRILEGKHDYKQKINIPAQIRLKFIKKIFSLHEEHEILPHENMKRILGNGDKIVLNEESFEELFELYFQRFHRFVFDQDKNDFFICNDFKINDKTITEKIVNKYIQQYTEEGDFIKLQNIFSHTQNHRGELPTDAIPTLIENSLSQRKKYDLYHACLRWLKNKGHIVKDKSQNWLQRADGYIFYKQTSIFDLVPYAFKCMGKTLSGEQWILLGDMLLDYDQLNKEQLHEVSLCYQYANAKIDRVDHINPVDVLQKIEGIKRKVNFADINRLIGILCKTPHHYVDIADYYFNQFQNTCHALNEENDSDEVDKSRALIEGAIAYYEKSGQDGLEKLMHIGSWLLDQKFNNFAQLAFTAIANIINKHGFLSNQNDSQAVLPN